MNQCIRLLEALSSMSQIRPVDEVKLATAGIVAILGNTRSVKKLLECLWFI
jgi:hypothetical protein